MVIRYTPSHASDDGEEDGTQDLSSLTPTSTTASSFVSLPYSPGIMSINSSPGLEPAHPTSDPCGFILEQDLLPTRSPYAHTLSARTFDSSVNGNDDMDIPLTLGEIEAVSGRISRLNSQTVDEAMTDSSVAYPSLDVLSRDTETSPHCGTTFTASITSGFTAETALTPSSGGADSSEEALAFYRSGQSSGLKYDYDALMPSPESLEEHGGIDGIPVGSSDVNLTRPSENSNFSDFDSILSRGQASEPSVFDRAKDEWRNTLTAIQLQLSDLTHAGIDQRREAWENLQYGLREMSEQGDTIVDVYATTTATLRSDLSKSVHFSQTPLEPQTWRQRFSSLQSDAKALSESSVLGNRETYADRAAKTLTELRDEVEGAMAQTERMQGLCGAREAWDDLVKIRRGLPARAPGYERSSLS